MPALACADSRSLAASVGGAKGQGRQTFDSTAPAGQHYGCKEVRRLGQILSVSVFEKNQLSCALQANVVHVGELDTAKQLNLFKF